jgi:4-alpha-glucanotransferase
MLDISLGVPPDDFSATGQDWGMPVYRWDVVAEDDFSWLRGRARRSADLYDGYRVDHLVGCYRTDGRPRDGGEPFFTPPEEPEQLALGERTLALFREPGAEIVAEDLGTVPDFVRASLARLSVPGYKVFRWERRWHDPGQPFRDPADYPAASVATSGTHDTEPQAVWWEQTTDEERREIDALPTVQALTRGTSLADAPYEPTVGAVLLEAIVASGSDLTLIPIGDAFGWRQRINEPATVSADNWSFRLPWPCDRLDQAPEAEQRRRQLRAWSEAHGRLAGGSAGA